MAGLPALLATDWPPDQWRDVTVLAAVSGGADSIALLRSLEEVKQAVGGAGGLIVGHFHQGLRGAEADADAAFVADLCACLGLECVFGKAGAGAKRDEASARRARYRFLKKAAHAKGARFVAVAHTADDQAETILHRIARGTGLRGLAGMPRTRLLADGVALVRPLLAARRNELTEYLASLGQDFRSDATNESRVYTRNYIRHEIAPRLQAGVNQRSIENVVRLGELAREAQTIVRRQVRKLYAKAVRDDAAGGAIIALAALADQPEPLVCELALYIWRRRGWPRRSLSRQHVRRLVDWLQSSRGAESLSLPGGVLAVRNEHVAKLSRPPESQSREQSPCGPIADGRRLL